MITARQLLENLQKANQSLQQRVQPSRVAEGSNDLRSSVLDILQQVYQGASKGEEMIDYLADELDDWYTHVKMSGDKVLQQAYNNMMDQGQEAEGDPKLMAQIASQAIKMLNQQGVAEGSYKTYKPKHVAWVVRHGDGKVSEFKPHEDDAAKAKYDQVKDNRGASIYAIDQHSQSIPMGSLRALRKKQGVAEGERFPEPLTGYHIVYRKTGNVVHGTPSFETRDQAQKYLMTKMFANHQDFKVAHTAGVKEAKRQPETFGGYDPDDFQEKLLRLRALAGAGPLKTVYDPKRRVYRNMPTAVQPPRQPKK